MTTEETNVALLEEVERLRGQVQLLRVALAGVMGTDPDSRKMLELMRKVITTVPAGASANDPSVWRPLGAAGHVSHSDR